MGKRERRRRRERLAEQVPLAPQLPRRHDIGAACVRMDGSALTRRLAELDDKQRAAQAAVDDEIDRLVAIGVGWPAIATALRVSRQAARQRWLRRQA